MATESTVLKGYMFSGLHMTLVRAVRTLLFIYMKHEVSGCNLTAPKVGSGTLRPREQCGGDHGFALCPVSNYGGSLISHSYVFIQVF